MLAKRRIDLIHYSPETGSSSETKAESAENKMGGIDIGNLFGPH